MPLHFEFTYHFEDKDFESRVGDQDVAPFIDYERQAKLLMERLRDLCDEAGFQVEKGEQKGRLHIQGHMMMNKIYANKDSVVKMFRGTQWTNISIRPTCTTVVDDIKHKRLTIKNLYCAKEETRIAGPWFLSETEKPQKQKYIPRQQREIEDTQLYHWQKWLIEDAKGWNTRTINIIFNKNGNEGKSWLAQRLRLMSNLKIFQVAAVKDGERLEADMCSKLIKAKCQDPNAVFVDLPRAMPKEHLNGIFAALENIKSGYLNDTRNEPKEWDYDCPNIYVFTNWWPNVSYLSADRWKFWEISNHEIIERNMDYINNYVELYQNKKRKRQVDTTDAEE